MGICASAAAAEALGQGRVPAHRADVLSQSERVGK